MHFWTKCMKYSRRLMQKYVLRKIGSKIAIWCVRSRQTSGFSLRKYTIVTISVGEGLGKRLCFGHSLLLLYDFWSPIGREPPGPPLCLLSCWFRWDYWYWFFMQIFCGEMLQPQLSSQLKPSKRKLFEPCWMKNGIVTPHLYFTN